MAVSLVPLLNHLRKLSATESDSDLARLDRFARLGDQRAFAALVDEHGPMVLRVCRRVLGDAQAAEDAMQATFLVLARKARAVGRADALAGWLHGVARRVALKARAGLARRGQPLSATDTPADKHLDPLAELSVRELLAIIDEEVARLPRDYRLPVLLCCLEGQSQEEAAQRLGWTAGSVKGRLERGRKLLHARLLRRGIVPSAVFAALEVYRAASRAAMPTGLTAATVWSAVAFTKGHGAVGAASSEAARLATEILGGAGTGMAKLTLVLLLVVALTAVGATVLTQSSPTERPPQPQPVAQPAPAHGALVDQFGDPLPEESLARLGTIRLRHGRPVSAIAFAPDGLSLASAGRDGTVHTWETATGKELLRIEHELFPGAGFGLGAVVGLSYSPDGKVLAGARMNQQPCLWDVATGKEIRQFGGKNHRADWVVLSPDGKTLAYGGVREEQEIGLADVSTGKDLHKFVTSEDGKDRMTRIAFSPDKKTFASADDKGIVFFELAAGQVRELARSEGQEGRFWSLSFSSDGKTLAAVNNSTKLVLVDVPSGKIRRTIEMKDKQEERGSIVFSPDGKTLLSGHYDGFVRFWDVASGTKLREFRAYPRMVTHLALSPDGKTLATTTWSALEHVVRLWETETGKPLVRQPGPQQGIAQMVFSPDSRRVATASWEGAVQLWEAATGKLRHDWKLFGPLAFTSDGQTLIVGGWSDGTVRLLDLTTGKETGQFSADAKAVYNVCLARDGKILATTGGDRFIRPWDLATGRMLQDFGGEQKEHASRIVLSPDGKLLVSVHQGKFTVRLWDTGTGKLLREHTPPGSVSGIAFSPDGKLLASTLAAHDGNSWSIRLCEVSTGKEIRQLNGDADPLDTIAFSPDGRCLIWGGQHKKTMSLWEVATGQLRRKFVGHQGELSRVAFSPDGRMMASASADATVLIWDATGHRRRLQSSAPLNGAMLKNLWNDLAGKDAAVAYQAICTLGASPRQAVALFEQHLKPVRRVDAKELADALRDLDNDDFNRRDEAAKLIESFGEAAEPALRKALGGSPSLEFRRRVEQCLARFEGPELLRRSRALETLENAGDSESRRLLTSLANGAPGAWLTTEAQAALDRLGAQ